MDLLSIIVPCYNEEETIPLFLEKIRNNCKHRTFNNQLSVEIIFINDGSKDGTLNLIKTASQSENNIHYISFSRNFGKESAILAGLRASRGDYVVLMDADLQHPPEILEEMYRALKSGKYDIAAAKRKSRKGEPWIRSLFSHMFYRIINNISCAVFVDGASDYRMLTRRVVNAILSIGEYNRFSKGIFGWIGFQTYWIPYDNIERVAGKTKWSFFGLFHYSIEGIIAYSTVPLSIPLAMGILFFVLSVAIFLCSIMKSTFEETFIWLVMMLIAGTLQISLGIIALYFSRLFLEVKHRPAYIIQEQDIEEDT